MPDLKGPQLRFLKARAQLLEPVLRLGKAGATDAFYAALDEALARHELVKVRFDDFKDQKKTLSPQMAQRTSSQLILRVGNVAVFYRQNPDPSSRKWHLPETAPAGPSHT